MDPKQALAQLVLLATEYAQTINDLGRKATATAIVEHARTLHAIIQPALSPANVVDQGPLQS